MLGVNITGEVFGVLDFIERTGRDAEPLKVDDASVTDGVFGDEPCELSEGSFVSSGMLLGG